MTDEDEAQDTEDRRLEEGDAEYSFEGFKVEFNERIALTPPATAQRRG